VTRQVLGGIGTRSLETEGESPAVLLLHGYSDSADTWRPLMAELAKRGHRAVAVDLPGCGSADRPPSGPVLPAIDRFVADLLSAHAQEGPRPLIVGNSLGAVAALRAGQDQALPLAGVVAISPAGLGHQPWVDLVAREPVIHRLLDLPVPVPMQIVRWGVRTAYRRLAVADPANVDPDLIRSYAAQYRSPADLRRFIREARSLLRELEFAYELERIRQPVLLVWGARDPLTPSSGARRLIGAVPGTELARLERCGHCAHLEEPARIADLIGDFARAHA
jgi:pimeloyl-ACP methyl ester carboxylesterase